MVRSFNGKNYLSVPSACEVSAIDNIEPIRVDDEEVADPEYSLKDAIVMGVMSLETYNLCIHARCKGKLRVTSSNIGINVRWSWNISEATIGVCSK